MNYLNDCKVKLLLILILSVSVACQQDQPRVLIIGDSISIGYTPFVKENLKDIAEVFHNPGNAQHTGTGLDSIKSWIGDQDWDIIQFNWGLWDLCYRHPDSKVQGNRDKVNGKVTFNLEDYAKNLEAIVKLIKEESAAELVFVTTSYVPTKEAGRFEEDAIRYNEIAQKIMIAHEVKINDIYAVSKTIHQDFATAPDNVHFVEEGYKQLGQHISAFLKQVLKK